MKKNGTEPTKGQRGEERIEQRSLPLRKLVRGALYDVVARAGLVYALEVLEEEREAVCGPRYRHDAVRSAYRAGTVKSSLVLGGQRAEVARPRARTLGDEEVMLPSWAAWSAEDPLEERAVEQMVPGVSTRRYARSLDPLPEGVAAGRATGKSSVSRRFVQGTERKLIELMTRDLSQLDVKVLFIDGVYVAEHVVIVAMAVDAGGSKQVLGLWEGATENAGAVHGAAGESDRTGSAHGSLDAGGARRQQGAGEGGACRVQEAGVDPTLSGALCRPPDYADSRLRARSAHDDPCHWVGIMARI